MAPTHNSLMEVRPTSARLQSRLLRASPSCMNNQHVSHLLDQRQEVGDCGWRCLAIQPCGSRTSTQVCELLLITDLGVQITNHALLA